jgi:hypothetical protein
VKKKSAEKNGRESSCRKERTTRPRQSDATVRVTQNKGGSGIEGRVRRRAGCRREKLAELGLRSQGLAKNGQPCVCLAKTGKRSEHISPFHLYQLCVLSCKPGANMSQNLSGSLAGRAVLRRFN